MAGDKEYEVEILMGVTTDTYDTEGEVTRRADVPTDILQQTEKLIPDFMGVVSQKPPYYSAVKYKGKPLYKWAREGRFIDVPPRDVEIKVFDLLGAGSDTVTARIVCSKGTYIRTLCHDLGEKLGIGACMKGLRRLATGPYNINDSVTLDKLETLSDINELRKYIIDI
jgi:tRNA pseudouridine55 synthase